MKDAAPPKQDLFITAFAAAAGGACAYLAFMLFRYGVLEGYLDHIEPNMAIAGWRVLQGLPIYQEYGAPGMMINPYGPLAYLVHALIFALFGGSIPLSKLVGALAVITGVILFFLHARRRYGDLSAYAGVILFIAFILIFPPYSMWNRPDPLMVLLVTAAVVAKDIECRRLGPWTPHIIIAVCIGLSVNLKAHSFIYFLPVVIDRCGWNGFRPMLAMALLSFVVFLLPFALPQASLGSYLQILLNQFGGRGIDSRILMTSLQKSAIYLAPGLLLAGLLVGDRRQVKGKDVTYFAVLAAGVALMLYPASAPGQGNYHFLPLFPITVDALLRFAGGYSGMPRRQKALLAAFPLLLSALALPVQRRLMRNLDRIAGENVGAEVRRVAADYGSETLQMGYGSFHDTHRLTYYKPILVFAGRPMTIDAQAVMETGFVGIDIAKDFISELRACKTRRWLIPKGEPPFGLRNYYNNKNLFGDAPVVFQATHEKTASFTYFDLWTCKGDR